jgi:iron complex outermembrane recepter protein
MKISGRLIYTVLALLLTSTADAENTNVKNTTDSLGGVFEIGRVIVKGNKSSTGKLSNLITSKEIKKYSINDVPHAIDRLPGVAVTVSGGRNETGLSVRGFDLRQVPLYVDGIPVYVPYDGYVDIERFTTSDIAEIRVDKGYSSILYGPNALGGAINLVSAKPTHALEVKGKFELKGSMSKASDTTWLPENDGSLLDLSIGSCLSKSLYLVAGASGINAANYRLSKDFTPTVYQQDQLRRNSYHRDVKVNAKLGYVPSEGNEYVASYVYQHGEKGVPLYAGANQKTTARYWLWPYWDRQSVYLNTRTALGKDWYLKIPVYYDKLSNSICSYDSSDYRTIKKPYAFKSWYDDYTIGSSIEAGTTVIPSNDLRLAIHYKRDSHTEYNENDTAKAKNNYVFVDETKRKFIDNTVDAGLEDGVRLLEDNLIAGGGASVSYRGNERADNYFKYHTDKKSGKFIPDSIAPFDKSNATAWNTQGKIAYTICDKHTVSFSVARKTRFPTIKDRYSYKLGSAIPNPELKPENAIHYDLSYSGGIGFNTGMLSYQVNLYYIHLYNAIQSVDSVVKKDPSDQLPRAQMQNVGEATISGSSKNSRNLPALELSMDYTVLRNLVMAEEVSVKGNYNYAEKKNITNPAVKFTDLPVQKAMISLVYMPVKRVSLLGTFEWNSERVVNSQGTMKLAGYNVVNVKGAVDLSKNIGFEIGVNNLFDKNYSLQEGYPEEGRNYYVNMSIDFSVK